MVSGTQALNLMIWEDYAGHTLAGKSILLIFTNQKTSRQIRLKSRIASITIMGTGQINNKSIEIKMHSITIYNDKEKCWKLARNANTRLVMDINPRDEAAIGQTHLEWVARENNLYPSRLLNGQICLL